jgi:Zn-dependent peptidase ImmA (M78 family)
MKSLFDLFAAVGEHLSGRRIVLRFQQPSSRDADGMLTRLDNGRALIDVNPRATDDRQLYCFLHELAHAKLHWNELGTMDEGKATARLLHDPTPASKEYPRQESQADTLANEWLRYAEIHYHKYYPGSELECKLWALLEMTSKKEN